jgi:hypothetical protein
MQGAMLFVFIVWHICFWIVMNDTKKKAEAYFASHNIMLHLDLCATVIFGVTLIMNSLAGVGYLMR